MPAQKPAASNGARERIVEAAINAFAERGFHGTRRVTSRRLPG